MAKKRVAKKKKAAKRRGRSLQANLPKTGAFPGTTGMAGHKKPKSGIIKQTR